MKRSVTIYDKNTGKEVQEMFIDAELYRDAELMVAERNQSIDDFFDNLFKSAIKNHD